MHLGIIGLGKMGGNMCRRLIDGGHQVVATDPNPAAREAVGLHGAIVVETLDALVAGVN